SPPSPPTRRWRWPPAESKSNATNHADAPSRCPPRRVPPLLDDQYDNVVNPLRTNRQTFTDRAAIVSTTHDERRVPHPAAAPLACRASAISPLLRNRLTRSEGTCNSDGDQPCSPPPRRPRH